MTTHASTNTKTPSASADNWQTISLVATTESDLSTKRLDQVLPQLFPDYSRSLHQTWIKQGCVQVDGKIITQTKFSISGTHHISLDAQLMVQQENWQAQELPLDIVYEDDSLLVINKPAGLTVHPGAGQPDQTLVNALKFHLPQLETLPRAGLIHRLDKDTTGLLVVAKTLTAYLKLSNDMQQRQIKRCYYALVHGNPVSGGSVDAPIGRDRNHRRKMCVTTSGRAARTHYRIQQRFAHHCLLEVELETGRTHQIRVHMAHQHHPIVGDSLYSRHHEPPHSLPANCQQALRDMRRQALHAYKLQLQHPANGETMCWQAGLPSDLQNLLALLQSK